MGFITEKELAQSLSKNQINLAAIHSADSRVKKLKGRPSPSIAVPFQF